MDSIARKNNYISTDSDWVTLKLRLVLLEINSARLLAEAMEKTAETIFIIRWIKKMLNFTLIIQLNMK
jgi:hypothetical protein